MRISTTIGYAGRPVEEVEKVRELERAGLDVVWVSEAYGFDSPTLMGYLAARTTRVEIGSAIWNLYSRSPALLAQTAAGLDSVSGGRALVGLGASGPQVVEGWHGVPFSRPVARAEQAIRTIRAALRREVLRVDGPHPIPAEGGTGLGKPLKMLTTPIRANVPIYLAALKPRSVELAARAADGWMPIFFLPEEAHRIWNDPLSSGTAARADSLAPLEIVAGGSLAVCDDPGELLDQLRPTAALYIGGMGARDKNFYFDLACQYGYEAEATRIQGHYLEGRKREAESLVPSDFLARTNLVGPAPHIADRVAAYREAGVTVLDVHPVGNRPAHQLEQLRHIVDR